LLVDRLPSKTECVIVGNSKRHVCAVDFERQTIATASTVRRVLNDGSIDSIVDIDHFEDFPIECGSVGIANHNRCIALAVDPVGKLLGRHCLNPSCFGRSPFDQPHARMVHPTVPPCQALLENPEQKQNEHDKRDRASADKHCVPLSTEQKQNEHDKRDRAIADKHCVPLSIDR
jgi:hypothetical protein